MVTSCVMREILTETTRVTCADGKSTRQMEFVGDDHELTGKACTALRPWLERQLQKLYPRLHHHQHQRPPEAALPRRFKVGAGQLQPEPPATKPLEPCHGRGSALVAGAGPAGHAVTGPRSSASGADPA